VEPKRRPGNPRLDDDDVSVKVCVSLPGQSYDRLYKQAREQSVSVPEVIRRSLEIKTSRSD